MNSYTVDESHTRRTAAVNRRVTGMESCVSFHSQLASIMEVLANAAVAEICQLVDDGFAALRLEISRSQRENRALKSRLRLMEPPLLVPRTSKDHHCGEDLTRSTSLEDTDTQLSRPLVVTVQPVQPELEPEVDMIKKEHLDEERTSCGGLDHQTFPRSSIGPPSLCLAADGDLPLRDEEHMPGLCVSGQPEEEDFTRPEGTEESSAEKRLRAAAVDPVSSLSAELPGVETKTLDPDLSLTNTGVNGFWGAEEDSVKTEAESSWSEAFGTEPLVSSRLTPSGSGRASEAAESKCSELDAGNFDSSSFDELFSSPEVARSLTAAHKDSPDRVAGSSSSSSSFPFLSSFASPPPPPPPSSFGNSSPGSRSQGFPGGGGAERAFSCSQCSRLFCSSRDLLVHRRLHGGERIYHCHLCKKPFLHPHQLKTHQRVHTGEKPFSCAQCGKRFSQSSHIKRHMSVHTGEKRYSCGLCGKRFSQACSLKVHQTVHTGERPYSCTQCGKSFSVLGNLVRHQSVHVSK